MRFAALHLLRPTLCLWLEQSGPRISLRSHPGYDYGAYPAFATLRSSSVNSGSSARLIAA